MTTRILGACSPGEVRVAVVHDGILADYGIWRPGAPDGVGDVYRGRVIAKVPAMAGTFVALGDAEGFLPDSSGGTGLSDGDGVTVRITRAAQGGKGPRLAVHDCGPTGSEAPALLSRGPGVLLEFALRHADAPVELDDAGLVGQLRPVLGDRLVLSAADFDAVIEEAAEELAVPSIELPRGGRLHIQPTPALVAIDVDAGTAVGTRQGKTAAHLGANRAMLPELARQIRLRNLSGAIMVDFAGLPSRRRAALGPALANALEEDPVRPRLLGFTALGLAEIVRPRIHPPLHEQLAGPHAAGLAALRRVAAEVAAHPHRSPILRASPAIVGALQGDADALADLARRAGRGLILRSDPTLPTFGWMIEVSDERG
jgi:Ribonuclease G/E